ncbi:hypothetical protein BK809_0001956 [Diplodia seriata]|uniref:Uncharacterized protein n=1 Tax=Diplodia seriata TaxID=420778 RepID=A0A1S8BB98_9PEZI|nr:hypothetical protein BK809_0001956 [Diplodia seriata]
MPDPPPSPTEKKSSPLEFIKYTVRPVLGSFWDVQKTCGSTPAPYLYPIWHDAVDVLRHIEDNILHTNGEKAMQIKKQFSDDCTMLAVAAAIVAQVAITSLSLQYLDEVRWTAKASIIISLLTAVLSVFFSCRVQQKMTNLLNGKEVKDFLSNQIKKKEIHEIEKVARKYEELRAYEDANLKEEERNAKIPELKEVLDELDDRARYYQVSLVAAMMIKVPVLLLNASISTLIIGFGIYLKDMSVYDPDRGLSGTHSKYIYAIYVVIVVCGSLIYAIPWSIKRYETFNARHWDAYKKREDTAKIWRKEVLRERQKRAIDEPLEKAQKLAADIDKDYQTRDDMAKRYAMVEDVIKTINNGGVRRDSVEGNPVPR